MVTLRRYWFQFCDLGSGTPLNLGCGVTARDYADALELMTNRVFKGGTVPTISGCVEDIDVSTLDERHVLPNIGVVAIRGVWFPQGCD